MTITLDDVSCLLHLPVTGKHIDHVPSIFDRDAVKILLMTHLGILTEEEAMTVTNAAARVRLTWLVELYHRYIESGSCVGYHSLSFALGWQYNICQQVLDSHPCHLPFLPQQPGCLPWVHMGSHYISVPIRSSLLCKPVHQQSSWKVYDITHWK